MVSGFQVKISKISEQRQTTLVIFRLSESEFDGRFEKKSDFYWIDFLHFFPNVENR